ALDREPALRESKSKRKRLKREIKNGLDLGNRHRTGHLLDEDSLERAGRLSDVVELGLLREEAKPLIRRRLREALGERGIREEMFTHE
ncbi:hypothetical protein, partial [Streptomyces caniscabiei]